MSRILPWLTSLCLFSVVEWQGVVFQLLYVVYVKVSLYFRGSSLLGGVVLS